MKPAKVYILEVHAKEDETISTAYYNITNVYQASNKASNAFPYTTVIQKDCMQLEEALRKEQECFSWQTKDEKFWAKVKIFNVEDCGQRL